MRKKRIIFVDDSKSILVTMETILEDLVNQELVEASYYENPLKLLEDIKEEKVDYDLLFVDINMPQMDGLTLAWNIKQIKSFRQKPIITVTTENTIEMKQRAKEIGIAGWVAKPIVENKVLNIIKRTLRVLG